MLQYLLNTTAIWLLSLLMFDLFLRKESFHSYNRIYLLGTFLAGLLLPLWSWENNTSYDTNVITIPTKKVVIIKQQILESSTSYQLPNRENVLFLIYMLGLLISLMLLLRELRILIKLFKEGEKSKDGVWTIIETQKQHSPFSAFRYIFISNKANYTNEELNIILAHEEQHGFALHFIDLFIVQLGKIIFWFHPLVYVYGHRLTIVHEYQADTAVKQSPAEYGTFLIEQSLLSSAPSISHSFNRSPIKKRILMLTRKSSAMAKSKMFLAIPLLFISVLCFTKNAISGDKKIFKGNTVIYKGNVFELSENIPDTVMVEDPVSGNMIMKIVEKVPQPVKMNGETIHEYFDAATQPKVEGKKMRQYFGDIMMDEANLLSLNGYNFKLYNVVIDERGKVVYYTFSGLYKSYNSRELPEKEIKRINKKIEVILKNLVATPATLNGKAVPYLVPNLGN